MCNNHESTSELAVNAVSPSDLEEPHAVSEFVLATPISLRELPLQDLFFACQALMFSMCRRSLLEASSMILSLAICVQNTVIDSW